MIDRKINADIYVGPGRRIITQIGIRKRRKVPKVVLENSRRLFISTSVNFNYPTPDII